MFSPLAYAHTQLQAKKYYSYIAFPTFPTSFVRLTNFSIFRSFIFDLYIYYTQNYNNCKYIFVFYLRFLKVFFLP